MMRIFFRVYLHERVIVQLLPSHTFEFQRLGANDARAGVAVIAVVKCVVVHELQLTDLVVPRVHLACYPHISSVREDDIERRVVKMFFHMLNRFEERMARRMRGLRPRHHLEHIVKERFGICFAFYLFLCRRRKRDEFFMHDTAVVTEEELAFYEWMSILERIPADRRLTQMADHDIRFAERAHLLGRGTIVWILV